ncbi:tRNA nucleotidyltransferase [Pseudodesulfovibrio nedwellii]|nr:MULTISPECIES: tRNA nucleotidyltransferase [Pseudodesulfovibrio]
MRIYLAGGAVRDLLLGRTIHDRDYLVMDATRDEFMKAFPAANEVGLAFPVFILDRTEFSFPRATPLSKELKSRDLTVNAQLLNEDGELICHPKGLKDLHDKILRPASEQAFYTDPLRVFRAARFWAQLPEFTPHDELKETMRAVAKSDQLTSLAPDRIGQEVYKMLAAPAPGNFLRLLSETDCLSPWFDELHNASTIPAGPTPYHDTHVLEHICRTMDSLAGNTTAVWMGLCHDLGKTLTSKEKLPSHHGHDHAGIPLAKTLARRVRLSNRLKTAGIKAAQWHMIAARYDELRSGTKVDLLMDAHLSGVLAPLFELVRVDQDKDFRSHALRNLTTILAVKLRPEDRNLGAKSGEKLRYLRAQTLAQRLRK